MKFRDLCVSIRQEPKDGLGWHHAEHAWAWTLAQVAAELVIGDDAGRLYFRRNNPRSVRHQAGRWLAGAIVEIMWRRGLR